MKAGDDLLCAAAAESAPDGQPVLTAFGSFTSFKKGGVLDPNKSAAEERHRRDRADRERRRTEADRQPKKVLLLLPPLRILRIRLLPLLLLLRWSRLRTLPTAA